MYKKTFYTSSGSAVAAQKANVIKRQQRHSDPSRSSNTRVYGPTRCNKSVKDFDRLWNKGSDANDDEKKEERKRKEKDEKRIPEDEMKEQKALTVTKVDCHVQDNAKKHHTAKFHCTKSARGEDIQSVLRRGQEFEVSITFQRAYDKKKDDLFFVMFADDDNPGKNLRERFQLDEDGTDDYREKDEWGARILEMNGKKMKVAVYIPGNCIVGEWEMKVKTGLKEEKNCLLRKGIQIWILFNPWSKVDEVYMEKAELLNEYILNPSGTVYTGNSNFISSKPWKYGQFEEGILDISMAIMRKAYSCRTTPCMSDAENVSRALSRIVNSCDDEGVLVGNWSGNYEGGTKPTAWKGSLAILNEYRKTTKPVKYGQCWVFSHVLTTVCRALGLPARSVTTFSSGHDTDNTCTLDFYISNNDEELPDESDSCWNFHVWNEVWINNPTRQGLKYGGWQVIDATPQEMSCGFYQCGPCSVKAVKNGEVGVGFDTMFVFGEVNADCVYWEVDGDCEIQSVSRRDTKRVGKKISTKPPDGKPHTTNLTPWMDDKGLRLDITDQYKHPEGSHEERLAVERAIRFTRHGDKLYPECRALEVNLDPDTKIMVGEDMLLKAYVKNISTETKEVGVLMAARPCNYWNCSQNDKVLAKKRFEPIKLSPGKEEIFQLTVRCQDYLEECDEMKNLNGYVCARDIKANIPSTDQVPYTIGLPDLQFEAPQREVSGKPTIMKVLFTNPLDIPLTKCGMSLEGGLKLAPDDQNSFEDCGWIKIKECRDIKPKERIVWSIRVIAEDDTDEEEETVITEDVSFYCDQLDTITGCCSIGVIPLAS